MSLQHTGAWVAARATAAGLSPTVERQQDGRTETVDVRLGYTASVRLRVNGVGVRLATRYRRDDFGERADRPIEAGDVVGFLRMVDGAIADALSPREQQRAEHAARAAREAERAAEAAIRF
ncbi:hypothetical protein [Rhodovastum atsumiense]|uniref:Uncharacterized protein n=1 Tax=Rhodovastum atsumiense TaxID=504468 RepID=A0A5M6IU59_9PROT|nr:hypothetical protein [Rhodovastum atsumiense]KAA5611853.1 hypothetical protein F1189_12530 [Rhodovastum atsumiense]